MRKFTLTKQLFAAALVVAMGFTGCQKSEMEEVDETFRATSTSLVSNEYLDLTFSPTTAIVGTSVTITTTRLNGSAHGSLELFEYRVGGVPAQKSVVGGSWESVALATATSGPGGGSLTNTSYTWTPVNAGFVSYKVEMKGSQTRTIEGGLEIINPCVGDDISFNVSDAKIDLHADPELRTMYVEYGLSFCNSDVHRIVVTALLLQPSTIHDTEELVYSSKGKNVLIIWDEKVNESDMLFGVSFDKKIKTKGLNKMTGVWNVKLYDVDNNLIGEVNNPAHISFSTE